MADSEFERFKKMFPKKSDIPVLAVPPPIPGPGGLLRGVAGKAVQSGIRRFSDVNKGDKTTKMKNRQGTERRDPMEPRVVPSGRSDALKKAREGGGGPTKMKDRRGLDRKPEEKAKGRSIIPPVRGGGPARRQGSSAPSMASTVQSTKGAELSSMYMRNPTQRPYDASTSPSAAPRPKTTQEGMRNANDNMAKMQLERLKKSNAPAPPKPKAKPASLKKKVEKRKPEKKSKTRIAFEKEFAAARKKGKKSFPSKLGKYGTYSTKLK
jgi:hypothetical protein